MWPEGFHAFVSAGRIVSQQPRVFFTLQLANVNASSPCEILRVGPCFNKRQNILRLCREIQNWNKTARRPGVLHPTTDCTETLSGLCISGLSFSLLLRIYQLGSWKVQEIHSCRMSVPERNWFCNILFLGRNDAVLQQQLGKSSGRALGTCAVRGHAIRVVPCTRKGAACVADRAMGFGLGTLCV